MTNYRVLGIRRGTTVDGPGFRTSIYFAGCNHACAGCHNPDSWDFKGGVEMEMEDILKVIEEEDFDVTLTGGDPLMHPEAIYELSKAIKKRLEKNIWLYTGYTLSQIRMDQKLRKALTYIDTIVEGPFKQELLSPDLPFRGSSNQRIVSIVHDTIPKFG